MFPKSIRGRLQVWLAFLLISILTGFGVTAYQLHRLNRLSQIDEELDRRVVALGAAFRMPPFFLGRRGGGRGPDGDRPGWPPPRGRRPGSMPFPGEPPDDRFVPPEERFGPREIRLPSETLSLFDEQETNAFYFALWSPSGTLLKQSTNAPPGLTLPAKGDFGVGRHTRMRGAFRESCQFGEIGECVLAGRSIAADLAASRNFAAWLIIAGGGVLALGLGGGWGIASRAIRPVEEISATASRISAGNLAQRINLADTDSELGHLAGVLNTTFARLEAAFAQQQQFTSDASHELRTPIAVLISEAQTALARERSSADYRETVEACLDTAQQMRRLTESLLELARFDAGQEPIQRQTLDLAEMARLVVARLQALAEPREVQIFCDLSSTPVLGDPDRLGQVLTNLLTNAIHYNRPQGEIRVHAHLENGDAVLSVADTGIGISAGDLPRIFDRFYRADKSRARADGRSGLGLAISKAIVEAHGGRIEVVSEIGVGTTFTVRLPV